jgi:hypothetical protein
MVAKVNEPKMRGTTDADKYTNVGTNVSYALSGDILYIRVDCSDEVKNNANMSASGKSKVVGTTSGFTKVNGVSFSLNVICK